MYFPTLQMITDIYRNMFLQFKMVVKNVWVKDMEKSNESLGHPYRLRFIPHISLVVYPLV
jgi:hypothetical protein